jgi:hypothetical protein
MFVWDRSLTSAKRRSAVSTRSQYHHSKCHCRGFNHFLRIV